MSRQILVDTGPIVSLIKKNDRHHRSCVETAKGLQFGLVTCWAVVTEAAWLLRDHPGYIRRLYHQFEDGTFRLSPIDRSAFAWIQQFSSQYSNVSPQIADACLAYLAERDGYKTVFTLDRRDFGIFRLKGNRSLTIIP